MSGSVAVADGAHRPSSPDGPLHVRPPAPLPSGVRLLVASVVLVAMAVVVGSLVGAWRDDRGTYDGAAWRGQPQPPRSATIDRFDGSGPLGAAPGFGRWSDPGGDWERRAGSATFASDGVGVATVDAGSVDVVVYGQFMRAAAGTGLVASAPAGGVGGLWLVVADDASGWDLVLQGTEGAEVLESFDAPTQHVVVQLIHQGGRAKVSFDETVFDVAVPDDAAAGTWVGLVGADRGNQLDLFGYLPLPAG